MEPAGGRKSFYQHRAIMLHHSPEIPMQQDLLTHCRLWSYVICARPEVGKGKVWEILWQNNNKNPGSFVFCVI